MHLPGKNASLEETKKFYVSQLHRTRIAHKQEMANLKLIVEIKSKEYLSKMLEKAKNKFTEEMHNL